MEKLIELLNEWANQMMPGWSEYYEKGGNIYLKFKAPLSGEGKIENEVICSKRYEFIKWLVENDKIEREKFGNSETKSSKYSDFELSYDTPREDYTNTLLMELAIQDEPIQFLIEILR